MKVPWGDGDWRHVVVYGLGVSGQAAARFLAARGVAVTALDRRPLAELDLAGLPEAVRLALGCEPETLPAGTDGVVVSPGVPADRALLAAARRAGVPVVAEVELGFAFANGPVVGITGSNGKSTTTALTGALLRACGHPAEVCGNIGLPLTACVEGEPGRVFVTELSSFQLEAIDTFRPRAAALLNLSPDHLDRHGDVDAYLTAKQALFRNQGADDLAVLNADDPLVAATVTRSRRRFFSRRQAVADGCRLDGDRVVETAPGEPPAELFGRDEVPLPGPHNLENAMAAALLCRALGGAAEGIRAGLTSFRGLPHRLQEVGRRGGVIWYDDSKGTNLAATLRSLESFSEGSVHLILGGRHKGADPAVLAGAVRRRARRLYLIGEAAPVFEHALAGAAPIERAGDLERAVALAAAAARPGEVVLLSPACSSFDQYRNYIERAEHFQRLVAELGDVDG